MGPGFGQDNGYGNRGGGGRPSDQGYGNRGGQSGGANADPWGDNSGGGNGDSWVSSSHQSFLVLDQSR